MNGLMAHVLMAVPSVSQVKALPVNVVLDTVLQHNQAWRHGGLPQLTSSKKIEGQSMQQHIAAMDQQVASLSHAFATLQSHLEGQYSDLSRESQQLQHQLQGLKKNILAINMDALALSASEPTSSLSSVWAHTKAQWFT